MLLEFLLSVGPTGSSAAVISNLLNLAAALAGQGPRANTATFHRRFFFCVFFHRTEEAISFVAQVAVIFCLLVQLDGGCGRRGRGKGGGGCSCGVAAILLVKIKAFSFFYFAVTSCHLSASK